ncbi:DUF4180 domain-containing protein [Clostridium amazonitimonense]|uniref:DUF4180 domain-containing protein n=1 Tax=Clostridium amazonitimonense TaxID=1499689 RepID=UPI00050965E4|nr:DUF4180 domain-containing protein [Clostridium amazonitimonense]
MNYKIVNKNHKRYIEYTSEGIQLSSEQDVLDIIGSCMENRCDYLMLHGETLSEDFFNLRTGFAGMALQKFINYHIKVAIILNNEEKFNDRFKEMVIEANKGNHFRTFKNIADAEIWISSL